MQSFESVSFTERDADEASSDKRKQQQRPLHYEEASDIDASDNMFGAPLIGLKSEDHRKQSKARYFALAGLCLVLSCHQFW